MVTTKNKENKKGHINTGKKHTCKDGIERVLYQKGENFYVRVKSKVSGKFVFKKTSV